MTDFGRPAGDMLKSDYDADEDGVIDPAASQPTVTDHGLLDGRDDDDHTQYHNDARGDARYVQLENVLTNFIFPHAYKSIIAGTWISSLSSSALHNDVFKNDSHDLNDEIEFDIFAEAGSKTLELILVVAVSAAIITIYLDDVSQGTIDTYKATGAYNTIKTLNVTVVGTKMHSLKIKATDKHAASSNYYVNLQTLRII